MQVAADIDEVPAARAGQPRAGECARDVVLLGERSVDRDAAVLKRVAAEQRTPAVERLECKEPKGARDDQTLWP